ncbi:hypothetical protein Catovirus_2_254 [Catovirus CTV1]|uniref:Uncharacterized protein n=1 Tax=Catovirus CTV1 TaxID=1977631 RepID=A0A1V0SC66_9VIRU|nr:hypothetical protein Catovirus_2_254 [Catovirus CTV1]
MNSLDNTFKSYFPFVQNDVFTIAASLILIVYAAFIAPQISEQFASFLGNPFVKLIIFLVIAYICRYNPTVAVIATIAVIVSLMKYNEYKEIRNTMSNVMLPGNMMNYEQQFMGSEWEAPVYNNNCHNQNYEEEIKYNDDAIKAKLNEIQFQNKIPKKEVILNNLEEIGDKLSGNKDNDFTVDNLELLRCMGNDKKNENQIMDYDEQEVSYANFDKD